MSGRRRELKIKEFASTIGVSSRTVKRWAEAGIIPVVKRRTARGHVRTRIPGMPFEQMLALVEVGHPFMKMVWRRHWGFIRQKDSKFPEKNDLHQICRFVSTNSAVFLHEVFLGATNWESPGRRMRRLVGGGVLDELDSIYHGITAPQGYMVLLRALLPEERLSRLSADSLKELQDLVQTLTLKQRQVLKVMLRLQQENLGAPPRKSDVWRACKNDPRIGKMSRTTFWRYMKQPALRLFLERLYGDRDNSVPSLSSNHPYAT